MDEPDVKSRGGQHDWFSPFLLSPVANTASGEMAQIMETKFGLAM